MADIPVSGQTTHSTVRGIQSDTHACTCTCDTCTCTCDTCTWNTLNSNSIIMSTCTETQNVCGYAKGFFQESSLLAERGLNQQLQCHKMSTLTTGDWVYISTGSGFTRTPLHTLNLGQMPCATRARSSQAVKSHQIHPSRGTWSGSDPILHTQWVEVNYILTRLSQTKLAS